MFVNQSAESVTAARSRPSMVYICAPEDGFPVKIGVSNDLVRRLAGLQPGVWHDLQMREAFFALKPQSREDEWLSASSYNAYGKDAHATIAGARALEAACHRKLRDLDCHMRGEWFAITVEEAVKAVLKVAKLHGMAAVPVRSVLHYDSDALSRADDRKAYQRLMAAAIEAAECLGKNADVLTETQDEV